MSDATDNRFYREKPEPLTSKELVEVLTAARNLLSNIVFGGRGGVKLGGVDYTENRKAARAVLDRLQLVIDGAADEPPAAPSSDEVAALEFLADRLTWPRPIRQDLDLAEAACRRLASILRTAEPPSDPLDEQRARIIAGQTNLANVIMGLEELLLRAGRELREHFPQGTRLIEEIEIRLGRIGITEQPAANR